MSLNRTWPIIVNILEQPTREKRNSGGLIKLLPPLAQLSAATLPNVLINIHLHLPMLKYFIGHHLIIIFAVFIPLKLLIDKAVY